MKNQFKPGWGKLLISKKWHYYDADGRSLCRKYGFFIGDTEQGMDNHSENCLICKKKLLKRLAE